MIYPFKNIVFDCRQATLLSIKKDQGKITFLESIKLRYHLLYCDPCRRFIAQSHTIDRAGQQLNQQMDRQPPFRLSESAKEQLKKVIGSV